MNRMLIVDDKANNRYLLRMLLQGHGFAVDATQNGVEAWAKAEENAPDLVISDLLMPEMDGYELLRRWRADERFRAIRRTVRTAPRPSCGGWTSVGRGAPRPRLLRAKSTCILATIFKPIQHWRRSTSTCWKRGCGARHRARYGWASTSSAP